MTVPEPAEPDVNHAGGGRVSQSVGPALSRSAPWPSVPPLPARARSPGVLRLRTPVVVSRSFRGRRLQTLAHQDAFWVAWAALQPDTELAR